MLTFLSKLNTLLCQPKTEIEFFTVHVSTTEEMHSQTTQIKISHQDKCGY